VASLPTNMPPLTGLTGKHLVGMRKGRRPLLLGGLLIVFVAFAFLYSVGKRQPVLGIAYLSHTNEAGSVCVLFSVTNAGDAAAINFEHGLIEMFGTAQTWDVSCLSGRHRLAPGENDIVQVALPHAVEGNRWRLTCFYAREGIRSRFSDWQFGPGGPGARANWLLPPLLKGVPLDVTATTDWVSE